MSKRLDEEAARPAAIRQRLQAAPVAQYEVPPQRQLMAASEDASEEPQARLWALETRGEALSAEIEMLEQALLSPLARLERLEAREGRR